MVISERERAAYWGRVNRDGPTMPHMTTPCWEWTTESGGRPARYAKRTIRHVTTGVHRWSLILAGDLTAGRGTWNTLVCHRCDNRVCGRPDHLYIGTHQDNATDRQSARARRAACLALVSG